MSLENKTNINTDINGLMDKLFELSPKYQAIKIYNDEIKNNLNLSVGEKIAYALERRKILKQAENFASTLNLADLMLKDKEKSLEKEIINLDDDWLIYYTDAVKNFSHNDMQAIWARILASECENPGKISKRLLSILNIIDKPSAENFGILCAHSVKIIAEDNEEYLEFIFPKNIYVPDNDIVNDFISSFNIDYNAISELVSIGLLEIIEPSYYYPYSKIKLNYYGTEMLIKRIDGQKYITMGSYKFTKCGFELANALHDDMITQKNEKYIPFLIEYYLKPGFLKFTIKTDYSVAII